MNDTTFESRASIGPAERWYRNGERLCRAGRFLDALESLERALAYSVGEARAGYQLGLRSWYGLSLAVAKGEIGRGRRLCEEAIASGPLDAQLYVNLGRVYLLGARKDLAIDALGAALSIDPRHAEARSLSDRLGRRRPPVFPFLSRSHPVNRLAGRVRHRWL